MKKNVLLALLFILLIPCILNAQKKGKSVKTTKSDVGYEIVFDVANAPDTILYLAVYYRDKLILRDSAKAYTPIYGSPKYTGRTTYVFRGQNPCQRGLYKLVSQKRFPYLDFVIDGNQFFHVQCDTTGKVDNVSFVNSPQNDEVLAFQKKTVSAQQQMSSYRKGLEEAKHSNNQAEIDRWTEKIKILNAEMDTFIRNLREVHPEYLFSKMQKSYKQIEIPDPPVRADGTIDSTFQLRYYLTHYWDNVDLSDNGLLFTPVMEPKIKEYFDKYLQYSEPDTINKYVDMVLEKASKDTLMYHFFVDWLAYHYETSKMLGHDGVFVHLVKNNHMQGKCTWIDEDLLRKYEKRVKHLDPLLIGKQSVELLIPDTSMTDDVRLWHSSYRLPKPYVILWFYDPDCPTCKKESEKLSKLYDSLERVGARNFDVYAIGNDADIARWKKYVKEHNYPWINVGGNKANVDYLDAYNIYETGNPAMFILNEKREIILNRRIEISTIPEFLQQYEKRKHK